MMVDVPTIVLASLNLLIGSCAEWIMIPQFSDQHKVYRDSLSQWLNNRKDATDLHNISRFYANRDLISMNNGSMYFDNIKPYSTENIISYLNNKNNEHIEIDSDVKNMKVESAEEESVIKYVEPQIADDSNEDLTISIDPTESTIPFAQNLANASQYFNENNINNNFLNYFPTDLFKQVHKTLKSQSSTLKGKLRFLKVFERTLLNEIEARLSEVLAPSQISREARDHRYIVDDHDEKIGFPSLEGTLMAISFLTFAVYLVRLVMMLFRSTGTIGVAPIIIGRRKRSINDFNDERIRILNYLDSDFRSID